MTQADLRLTPQGLLARDRLLPCTIGRGGLTAQKQEGDGASPQGLHRVTGLLYRADRIVRPAPWAKRIAPDDLWSDAPSDPLYNQRVKAPYAPSHEKLWRADRLYDLVLVLDWNMNPAIPGGGSAIFIHRWRRPGFPTEGCIALRPDNLFWLAQHAHPGTTIEI